MFIHGYTHLYWYLDTLGMYTQPGIWLRVEPVHCSALCVRTAEVPSPSVDTHVGHKGSVLFLLTSASPLTLALEQYGLGA